MTNRARAATAGALIIAAYTSIASFLTDSVPLIVLLESTAGVEVIAIAILLYPLFIKAGQGLSLLYLFGKILEGGILVAASVLLLFRSEALENLRNMFLGNHVYVFVPASMILYILLFRTELVPRFISVWGGISLILLLTGNLLILRGVESQAMFIFYPMIILNEFFLAFWMIIKGFKTENNKG